MWFKNFYFIIDFHHFQFQVMKYTFRSNGQNCERPHFHHSDEKKFLPVKIPHNTCNLIMPNISSLE